jgi:RHS repeat-associated protein
VGRPQCKIDIYLPYGEVVFMDSTGRRKVHPAIVMDQEGFELDTTQTRCIEIDFPGKAMGMRHLLRRNTVAGPISWMGSLVQDNQDASGLMYRRNRFYDPQSGRFTQEDPIGLAGGVNLYGFAAGKPGAVGTTCVCVATKRPRHLSEVAGPSTFIDCESARHTATAIRRPSRASGGGGGGSP